MAKDNETNNSIPSDPITHVIFDLDGTLINSEKYLFKSINEILMEFGKEYEWSVRAKTIGLHMAKSAPIIVEHFQLPITADEYIQKVLKRFKAYVEGQIDDDKGVQLLPGVQRLVYHLAKHHIPMAICTGCMSDTYQYKTQSFGDFFSKGKFFHHIVLAGSDPEIHERNKPDPTPYQVCMSRFDMKDGAKILPHQVLVFEDSPTGLTSAVRAGCRTVFLPDPKIDRNSLAVKPDVILNSMLEFEPEMFGLPAFED